MADRDFEVRTFDDIQAELVEEIDQQQQNLPPGKKRLTDFSTGSIIMTIVRAVAVILARYWGFLRDLTDGFYISSSTGDRLKRRLRDFAFEMRTGYPATGSVLVVRREGDAFTGAIQVGDQLARGSRSYTVISASQSFGPVSNGKVVRAVAVRDNANGADGNLPANTQLSSADSRYLGLLFLVGTSIDAGMANATSGGLAGGVDDETPEEARTRFQVYIQNLGKGTVKAIEEAVKQVSGISTAKVWDLQRLNPATNEREEGYPGNLVVQVHPTNPGLLPQLPGALEAAVRAAVEANKAAGVAYEIQTTTPVALKLRVRVGTSLTDPSADWTSYTAILQDTIQDTFAALSIGETLRGRGLEGDLMALDRTKSTGGIRIEFTYSDDTAAGDQQNRVTVEANEILVLQGPVQFVAEAP